MYRLHLKELNLHNLVEIETIPDGSCFFHAILRATNRKYIELPTRGRVTMTDSFRKSLSEDISKRYTTLSRGELPDLARHGIPGVPISLREMKSHLRSREFAGQEYIEFVSNELKIDIYIVDLDREDVYMLGDTVLYHKRRPSIIIGYSEKDSHYSLVGQVRHSKVVTLFSCDHETISKIRHRTSKKSTNQSK